MVFNDIEKEVLFLKAVTELIDNMVNSEIFDLLGSDLHSEIRFKSRTHQKYFNIMLTDMLSCSDKKVLGVQSSYLEALQLICESPHFNKSNSINDLTESTKKFVDWLQKDAIFEKVWLPSIELETNLSIRRLDFIKISGNISKHNFSRLGGVIRELKGIFKRNDVFLRDEDVLLILDEFYEWFHTNIFNYHSSTIAEFLNNIRWGIYEYLLPEFKQSYIPDNSKDIPMYRYTYPNGVSNRLAKGCYWDLMNEMLSKPYMKKFQVTRHLKNSH